MDSFSKYNGSGENFSLSVSDLSWPMTMTGSRAVRRIILDDLFISMAKDTINFRKLLKCIYA